jgi:arylsulfatase A-like enzyme
MMKNNLSRRDFLKLASLLPLSSIRLPSNEIFRVEEKSNNDKHNVIIIIYDTMSAQNLSLYGYPRRTTPNLERFAKQATVFHAHYSVANFTTPGISSLLTGTYPWTHRAIN